MPGYVGFQIALELTNLIPREVVSAGITRVVNFARDLKNSGSDIVVEEDLAEIFGRGRISKDLEEKFKAKVRIQKFTPLSHGSEVVLADGAGPTVLRALRDSRYLATVVTLSMLGYFHNRENLARMISQSIILRYEAKVPGASGDPGYVGIVGTLTACSTQSAAFQWSTYRQLVEEKLRLSLLDYRYTPAYISLSPATLLGAMDFLYMVQSLPVDRKISVSCETGCIPLIIWAHYILELNVLIRRGNDVQVVFGNPEEIHVYIDWSENVALSGAMTAQRYVNDSSYCKPDEPVIHLHEKDMSVVLLCENDPKERLFTDMDERHPLGGYGTTYLERCLNFKAITPDRHPIYQELSSFATGLAIYNSNNLYRRLSWKYPSTNRDEEPGQAINLEVWRVVQSAELLFAGIQLDKDRIGLYADSLAHTLPKEGRVPTLFGDDNCKFKVHAAMKRSYVREVKILSSLILVFAHIVDLDGCHDMPLRIPQGSKHLPFLFDGTPWDYPRRFQLEPVDIFHAVSGLLSSSRPKNRRASKSDTRILNSDFGWSVFLDTLGNKDPGEVRPGLIHVQKGTPTNKRTGERKLHISDGNNFGADYTPRFSTLTGPKYVPRAVARVLQRTEFWTTQPNEFELTLYWSVELSPEINYDAERRKNPYETSLNCGEMHTNLWETFSTPECTHSQSQWSLYNRITCSGPAIKLPKDAVAVLGWEGYDSCPQKVTVLLTLGEPQLRWLAIMKGTGLRSEYDKERKTILRTEGCCEKCAVKHACSLPGKWALIL